MVLVKDKNDNELDPTSPARARMLLDKGRAEVVDTEPFTIKILDLDKDNCYTSKVSSHVKYKLKRGDDE